jgi:Bacterial pre-peptidase C-terminal domain
MLKQIHPLGRLHCAGRSVRSNRDQDLLSPGPRARNGATARHRPDLERLELRALLSSNLPPIASLAPYNGERLSQSPQELVITFNDVNVPALMGSFDVQIEELNRDGTKTPLWDPGDAPPELSDATGTELIIPMQKFSYGDFAYDNVTLPAGQYEIDLVGGTSISYAASGAFGPGPTLWDPNQDQSIGTFTILGQGATIGPSDSSLIPGQTTWGWIDPSNPTAAVDLYKFTLPAGNLWQVGLAISANSIGSSLLTDLSLFGADGTLIESRNSGSGIPANPNDPYLFAGLEPGTYYVGVSAAGNVPYSQGGYDPVLGVPGLEGITQPGGLFALNLVEAPHLQTTRLLTSALDYSTPEQNTPTGITLTFSGPIDLSNLFVPDVQESALEVLDSSGKTWPVTAESYEVSDAALNLIFDRPLPPGSYTLVSAAENGLVDLAEQPVLPAIGSSSVLARWNVSPPAQAPVPGNLGVLWPLSSNQTGSTELGSFHETTELATGQSIAFNFDIIVPGYHMLQTQIAAGDVAMELTGNNGTPILYASSDQALNTYLIRLDNGAYTLRFISVGSQTAAFDWLFKIEALDWEKILNNGVSQTSALSVSLFSTTLDDSGASGGSNSAQGAGTNTAFSTSASGANFAASMGPIPSTLMVTLNTGLIGPPALSSQNLPVVGPTVDGGSMALANSGNSLGPGFDYASTLDLSNWLADQQQPAIVDQAVAPGKAAAQALDATSPVRLAGRASETDSAAADERALGQVEWLLRLGARVQDWLGKSTKSANDRPDATFPQPANNLVYNERASSPGTENMARERTRERATAQVDLGAVTCAILVGAVACKLRRPALKWWRRHDRMLAALPEQSGGLLHRGPHAAITRSHARTRSHKLRTLRVKTRHD